VRVAILQATDLDLADLDAFKRNKFCALVAFALEYSELLVLVRRSAARDPPERHWWRERKLGGCGDAVAVAHVVAAQRWSVRRIE